MRSSKLAGRHNRFNEVACFEAVGGAACLGLRAQEAVFIRQGHLSALAACRFNQEGVQIGIKPNNSPAFAHTRGINPVGFGIALRDAIKLRAPACSRFNGQPCQLEPIK